MAAEEKKADMWYGRGNSGGSWLRKRKKLICGTEGLPSPTRSARAQIQSLKSLKMILRIGLFKIIQDDDKKCNKNSTVN